MWARQGRSLRHKQPISSRTVKRRGHGDLLGGTRPRRRHWPAMACPGRGGHDPALPIAHGPPRRAHCGSSFNHADHTSSSFACSPSWAAVVAPHGASSPRSAAWQRRHQALATPACFRGWADQTWELWGRPKPWTWRPGGIGSAAQVARPVPPETRRRHSTGTPSGYHAALEWFIAERRLRLTRMLPPPSPWDVPSMTGGREQGLERRYHSGGHDR